MGAKTDCPAAKTRVAAAKLLYLALRNLSKKWTQKVHDWQAALNRFAIIYEGRLPID